MTIKNGTLGSGLGAGIYGHAGDISTIGGTTYVNDGTEWVVATPYQPSVAELEARDAYEREKEIKLLKHKERVEALKTIFPRGYQAISGFEHMVDIARENQLNPLYETVLKEFEEAQSALHRAANKLASAVKLTDSDEVSERSNKQDADYFTAKMAINSAYGNMSTTTFAPASYSSAIGGIGANLSVGPVGPPGATGMMGPKGDKGDKGDPGKDAVIDEGLIKRLIRKVMGESK